MSQIDQLDLRSGEIWQQMISNFLCVPFCPQDFASWICSSCCAGAAYDEGCYLETGLVGFGFV